MNPVSLSKWAEDYATSNDDINKIILPKLVEILNTTTENIELIELLNKKHGGSRIGRSSNVNRDHAFGPLPAKIVFGRTTLMSLPSTLRQCSREDSKCGSIYFSRSTMLLLKHALTLYKYPMQLETKARATFKKSEQQDCSCMVLWGMQLTEYIRIEESTTQETFKKFVKTIV